MTNPNVLATPHIRYVTEDEFDLQVFDIFDQIDACATGARTPAIASQVPPKSFETLWWRAGTLQRSMHYGFARVQIESRPLHCQNSDTRCTNIFNAPKRRSLAYRTGCFDGTIGPSKRNFLCPFGIYGQKPNLHDARVCIGENLSRIIMNSVLEPRRKMGGQSTRQGWADPA